MKPRRSDDRLYGNAWCEVSCVGSVPLIIEIFDVCIFSLAVCV